MDLKSRLVGKENSRVMALSFPNAGSNEEATSAVRGAT